MSTYANLWYLMLVTLTSEHKNELDHKKILWEIIIISENLCAKPNGVTGQKLGWETHQNKYPHYCNNNTIGF